MRFGSGVIVFEKTFELFSCSNRFIVPIQNSSAWDRFDQVEGLAADEPSSSRRRRRWGRQMDVETDGQRGKIGSVHHAVVIEIAGGEGDVAHSKMSGERVEIQRVHDAIAV